MSNLRRPLQTHLRFPSSNSTLPNTASCSERERQGTPNRAARRESKQPRMVAKTPTKQRRMPAALNPNLVRETLNKVDRCMARLQELQFTINGGTKVVSGVTLSPRSTKGYLKTSLRCKQESLRMKNNVTTRKSPVGKFQGSVNGEWRRMSLPAMLLGETVAEILEASQIAKELTQTASKVTHTSTDPKTPITFRRSSKQTPRETSEMQVRRAKEKQGRFRIVRAESSPVTTRARSRIRFKPKSPIASATRQRPQQHGTGGRPSVTAHRVSPRNRPWAKKTVLFPNALYQPSSSSPLSCHGQRFYKTKSSIIGRTQPRTPHKFLIKSPPTSLRSKFASKKAVEVRVLKASPEKLVVLKARRCSFSPSKLVNRLVSPIKTRISHPSTGAGWMGGLKQQRPSFGTPVRIPAIRRI